MNKTKKVGGGVGHAKVDDSALTQTLQEEILIRTCNSLASLARVALEVRAACSCRLHCIRPGFYTPARYGTLV